MAFLMTLVVVLSHSTLCFSYYYCSVLLTSTSKMMEMQPKGQHTEGCREAGGADWAFV